MHVECAQCAAALEIETLYIPQFVFLFPLSFFTKIFKTVHFFTCHLHKFILYNIPVSAIGINNATLGISTIQHLCKTTGCFSTKLCRCDVICTLYDDCCKDYKDLCSSDEDEFQQILDSRDIRKTDLKCVRTLNFKSRIMYKMISTCNKDLGIVKESCENPKCTDTLSNVPVTDSVGISYRNVYCAVCHDNVNPSNLTAWKSIFDMCRPSHLVSSTSITSNLKPLCGRCEVSLRPSTLSPKLATALRKCSTSRSSGESGLKTSFSLSILVDFGTSSNTMKTSITMLGNKGVVRNSAVINCKQGEVFVDSHDGSTKCVPVSCQDGFQFQDGACIPALSPCKINGANSAIKVKLVVAGGSCKERSFQHANEEFLKHLFRENFLSEISFAEESNMSNVCNDDNEKVVDVTYIVFADVDLFDIVQHPLDNNMISNSINGVSSKSLNNINIRRLEITQSCLNPSLNYKCNSDWIPHNQYLLARTEISYPAFLNKTSDWVSPDGVMLKLHFDSNDLDPGFEKQIELKTCHIDNSLSCPVIKMDVSLFEISNSSDLIRYLPDNRVLKPNEYNKTGDQILVCNFFNQSD